MRLRLKGPQAQAEVQNARLCRVAHRVLVLCRMVWRLLWCWQPPLVLLYIFKVFWTMVVLTFFIVMTWFYSKYFAFQEGLFSINWLQILAIDFLSIF